MKKRLQKIITLLLVFTMIFGISATTVAAAGESNDEVTSSTGGVVTGWCDISYDENGVTVVLNPDVQSILDINKEELASIMNTLIDAAKALVIDDLKQQILDSEKSEESGDVNAEDGITAENIWEKSLKGYIRNKYPEYTDENSAQFYIEFLKGILNDSENTEIKEFTDYAMDILRLAVNTGLVAIEDLPDSSDLAEKLTDIFESEVNKHISSEAAKYVDTYIKWLKDETVSLNDDIKGLINTQVTTYITAKVNAYVANHFELVDSYDSVDKIIADYMNSEIVAHVDAWLSYYATGEEDKIPDDIVHLIDLKINGWVAEIAATYGTTQVADNPIYDAVKDEIPPLVDTLLENYIDDYLHNRLSEEDTLALDAELKEIAPALIYTEYWLRKDDGGAMTGTWAEIHNSVRDAFIDEFVTAATGEGVPEDRARDEAADFYDTNSSSDIIAKMLEYDAEAESKIKNEIKAHTDTYTHEHWEEIWDYELGADTKTHIMHEIEKTDLFILEAREQIKHKWENDADARHKAISYVYGLKTTNFEKYKNIRDLFIDEAKHDDTYKEAVNSKINEYLVDVIGTLRKAIDGITAGELEALEEKVIAEANKKLATQEFRDEVFNLLLEVENEAAVTAKVNNELVPYVVKQYEITKDEIVNTEDREIDYKELIKYIESVSLNGKAIFENGYVKLASLKELAAELPRPEEIANMTNEEMQLVYAVAITTNFGDVDFDVTLRLGGGYDKVRKLARLVAEYIDFGINSDGTIVLNVRVPAKFAKLLLKVCETGRLPDNLKQKVFALISGNADDAVALLNSLTLDELVSLLDYIPVDSILDSEYLANFERLDGLSTEEIKDKILEYQGYYDKLIKLVNRVYDNYVPEDLKDKTLADLYKGSGSFEYAGTHSVNVEKVLSKFSEKYAALLASFVDKTTVTASVDITVSFNDINKVKYIIDGKTHIEGFLPVGADIAMFAGIKQYEGKSIVGWVDVNDNEYTVMPDADIILYPVFAELPEPGTATITPGNVEKVYDGETTVLTVDFDAPEGATNVTYQWYKNGVLISGATTSTYAVKNVLDSGIYVCVVAFDNGRGTDTMVSNAVSVTITKKVINLNNYTWKPESFIYDGNEKSVYLVDAQGNALLAGVEYLNNSQYTNTATNAGTYTAKIAIDEANCTVTGMATEFEWVINKAVYDMSGIAFNDKTVSYDGQPHSITIEGTLPQGVTVTYSGNAYSAPGTYKITATFTGNPNYEPIANMTATLRILSLVKEFSYKDIIFITAENGISSEMTLSVKDVTTQYGYVESDEIFGKNMVGYVYTAYNIYFSIGATTQNVSDNFNVKILLPETLRDGNRDFKIVYINENGNIEDMNATREGDYLIFDTTHFSVYAIVEAGAAPVKPTELDLTWLWVLISILAVIAIAAVVIIIIIKKRKGENPDDTNNDAAPKTPVTEPNTDETMVEETVVEEPVAEEPTVEETVVEEPAAEEPTVEETVVEETVVEETVAEETVVEETAAEEPTVEETVAEESAPVVKKVLNFENAVGVRYRTSFMSRLIQAEEQLQDYYTKVKNVLLSYKGVKARSSWNFESFNKGRVQCAKLNIKGSALQVYLALDTKEYNANKYHFVDVSDKPKLDQVPMLLKVKSERSLQYAIELIEEMMNKLGMQRVESKYVDYHMPYETTEALAARDLVKVILPKGVTLEDYTNVVKVDVSEFIGTQDSVEKEEAPIVEAPVLEETVAEEPTAEETADEEAVVEEPTVEEAVVEEPVVEEPVVEELHLDAVHADEIISDEEAEEKIEIVEKSEKEKSQGTKLVEINLDTICENFEEDEVVTLSLLKAKRLVSKNAGRLKVLARGVMTKRLTIYADKFSIQAVKMITLAGGHADQYK